MQRYVIEVMAVSRFKWIPQKPTRVQDKGHFPNAPHEASQPAPLSKESGARVLNQKNNGIVWHFLPAFLSDFR
jgi:hypothetical protein